MADMFLSVLPTPPLPLPPIKSPPFSFFVGSQLDPELTPNLLLYRNLVIFGHIFQLEMGVARAQGKVPYFTGCKSTPVISRPPYLEVSILRFKVFTQRSITNHSLLLTHQQIM